MDKRIRKILIAGGGTAGWISAATLVNALQGRCQITLIESDAIGTIGVGEATIPPIRTLNASLGIDEREFVSQTQGSFKLGIQFVNWVEQGHSYFHPFGTHGRPFDLVAVHQHWLRSRSMRDMPSFDEMSMAWQLAKANKFARPVGDPRDVMSTCEYAYHFDAGLYARYLRGFAEKRGVVRQEGRIGDVSVHPETGFVTSVTLEDGQKFEADLFIDCTGFRGLLIEGALEEPFEDWGRWLVCDSAVTVGTERLDPLPSFTRSTAHKAGWQWRIPLQHRTGNGHVYCSRYTEHDEAQQTLVDHLDTPICGEPRRLSFRTGIRRNQWVKNVVSVGLASGFMEPLESTSIHLIQANVSKLLAYFPDLDFDPAGTAEFNNVARIECERIRDFLVLHYRLNKRHGDPMWDYCRTMDIPETLAIQLEHFANYGRHLPRDKDIFAMDSWLAVQIGQQNYPQNLDPLLAFRPNDATEWLMQLQKKMQMTAAGHQSHAAFIAQHCAAEPL